MVYSSVAVAHKQNHGDIDDDTNSGVSTAIVNSAFNKVKARIKAAGLTPPASDETLAEAENAYINAKMVWKGRMMGHLPSGANGSIVSNDNVNTSMKLFNEEGDQLVDAYIASVNLTEAVQPSDTDGVARLDAIGSNFKLHQRTIGTFTEV